MKIWLKLLIGSLLGIILGLLLPYDNKAVLGVLAWLEQVAVHVGRYAAAPMLVFSLTVAIYELRQDGHFWGLILRSFAIIIGSALFVIVLGVAVIQLFPTAPIPILFEEQIESQSLMVRESILELFPSNMFTALTGDGTYLLPLCVFAFFFGIGLSYDRNYSKPVLSLTDTLSRIFYHIGAFFSEILGFVIIAISAYWAVRFHGVLKSGIFSRFMLILAFFSGILGIGIFPLFLYLLRSKARPKSEPWVVLYGSLGGAVGAFFSGDSIFILPLLLRQAKENLGAQRRVNTIVLPLFTAFCRAGSAMVAAMAFIVIIKSYSYLDITVSDQMAIGIRAFAISFLLARHPGGAAYAALAALCAGYGRGFETGYLILKPLAFYLIAIGAFLDTLIASFAVYAIAKLSGFHEEREIRQYI